MLQQHRIVPTTTSYNKAIACRHETKNTRTKFTRDRLASGACFAVAPPVPLAQPANARTTSLPKMSRLSVAKSLHSGNHKERYLIHPHLSIGPAVICNPPPSLVLHLARDYRPPPHWPGV